ncbi:PP2C family protein-serine/threonine phosphatase [Motiliproteus sp. SC1-56]|uniref:PP2C family protein-serine/threonine phosphatase n=1 Tax=Motiliproteus sp. SC1-56 TaxID=2799565 RepID=UPI001A8CECFE|nr:SpoIIE family protein phosphatase [Motiliproteus sp. SC1-56]
MKQNLYCLLVVEDDLDASAIAEVREIFSAADIRVCQANTREAVDAALEEGKPDMLFSVTPFDGDENWIESLVERVKPNPVVALSRESGYAQVIRALRQGASDFFTLPVRDRAELARSIRRQGRRAKVIADSAYFREELEQSLALLREDQQAGRHVQQKMLPPTEMVINDYRFEYRVKPSLFLSGDFIDFFRISDSLAMFYLADISGHGASSAFVTVLLKNMTNRLLRNYNRGSSFHILSPTDVLSRINKELLDTGLGKHLTIFVGLLDRIENTLQYGVGGHFPMPILQQGGKAEFLPGSGMPVGLFDDAQFDGRIVELEEQFTLTLFSDGILEILDQPDLKAKEKCLLDAAARGYDDLRDLSRLLGIDEVEEAPDDIAALSVSRVV